MARQQGVKRQNTPVVKVQLPVLLELKKYKRKHKLRSLSAAVKMLMEAKK